MAKAGKFLGLISPLLAVVHFASAALLTVARYESRTHESTN
jgi:hypothetical protein